MSTQPNRSRGLRILAIVLLSVTAAVTLLGAIGTTCVAFGAQKWGPRMAALIPVMPIFQLLVVVSIAAGLWGVYSTVQLGRGKRGAYTWVLIFLLVGLVASGIQMYYSATLRGSTAPNNMRVYITAFTLAVMLLFRLPGLWQKSGFEGGTTGSSGSGPAAGMALFLCGLISAATPLWVKSSHWIFEENTAAVLLIPLLVIGSGMMLAGGLIFFRYSPAAARKALQEKAGH